MTAERILKENRIGLPGISVKLTRAKVKDQKITRMPIIMLLQFIPKIQI
jgi:hypothetical protein